MHYSCVSMFCHVVEVESNWDLKTIGRLLDPMGPTPHPFLFNSFPGLREGPGPVVEDEWHRLEMPCFQDRSACLLKQWSHCLEASSNLPDIWLVVLPKEHSAICNHCLVNWYSHNYWYINAWKDFFNVKFSTCKVLSTIMCWGTVQRRKLANTHNGTERKYKN